MALSRIHRSICFGHCCAHHQEPPPTAFAASGYRVIAGLDVLQVVVGLLVIVVKLNYHSVHARIKTQLPQCSRKDKNSITTVFTQG
jgi:hypothetical protein